MNATNVAPPAVYDVVVVGGGMVGALFANALGGSALKVAVIEKQPINPALLADFDLRVSALTLASQTMLQRLGAWAGIERRRHAPVRSMQVWDTSGRGAIVFDAADMGEPCLAFIVENSVIVAALRERLEQHTNVHVLHGADINDLSIDGDAAQLLLADGRRLQARLIVAADGADSGVRRRLGIEVRAHALHQQAIVATVRTALAHANTARQAFLASGPLAFLPLPEAHTCSIVWSADDARAQELLTFDDARFCTELQTAFGNALGDIRSVSARMTFPLTLAHTQRYIDEHVALIGDAAHSVHPLAGQGVNLGFLDAASLAEVVLQAVGERRDIGSRHVLRRYERWRKGDNLAMIAATGGFKYLFGNEGSLLSRWRGAGLSMADRAAPLKNLIMRRASGLVGDLPALARRR